MSDAPITMAQMELLMSKMMSDVAKKEDLHDVKKKVSETAEKVDSL